MKTCKVCGLEKPYDKTQKKDSKASGFNGRVCWDCQMEIQSTKRGMPENRAKAQAACKAYYQASRMEPTGLAKIQEHARKSSLAWAKKYPEKATAKVVKRKMVRLQRIPPWANLKAIEAVYTIAKAAGLTVDHIVPLRGKLVSGLHVHYNLQLLTKTENSRKGNRYE